MTKTIKKPYIAPSAELILLAPLEALANQTLSTGDQIALNKWGKSVFSQASAAGGNFTYWREDGKIYKK